MRSSVIVGSRSGRTTVSREPMIDVSGVRSSWLTTETKSVFIWAISLILRPISAAAS